MSEVAHRNLVAGSARFIHALLVLMMLGAGAASAWLLLEPLMDGRLQPLFELGGLVMEPALMVVVTAAAVVSCSEIMGLNPNRWLASTFVGVLANATAQFLGWLDIAVPVLAFASAMVLTITSNAMARLYREPSQAFLVPGFLLLVPGITGFRAIGVLATGDIVSGLATILVVFAIALGLVLGVLFGHVLLSSRKAL